MRIPTMRLAGVLIAAIAASSVLPAAAQTTGPLRHPTRAGALNIMNARMLPGPFIDGPMVRVPIENGTLRQTIDTVDTGSVTSVQGGTVTFTTSTGTTIGLNMPAKKIRQMRITRGTKVRLALLPHHRFKFQVIGGRLARVGHGG